MGNGISTWLTCLGFGLLINPPISLGFLKVQALEKLFDGGDLVSAFVGVSVDSDSS